MFVVSMSSTVHMLVIMSSAIYQFGHIKQFLVSRMASISPSGRGVEKGLQSN
jgi:hypothetical protein